MIALKNFWSRHQWVYRVDLSTTEFTCILCIMSDVKKILICCENTKKMGSFFFETSPAFESGVQDGCSRCSQDVVCPGEKGLSFPPPPSLSFELDDIYYFWHENWFLLDFVFLVSFPPWLLANCSTHFIGTTCNVVVQLSVMSGVNQWWGEKEKVDRGIFNRLSFC